MIHFDLQKICKLLNGTNNGKFEGYEKTNHPEIINKGLKGLISEQKDAIIAAPMPGILLQAVPRTKLHAGWLPQLPFREFCKGVDAFKPKVFVLRMYSASSVPALWFSGYRKNLWCIQKYRLQNQKTWELKRSQFLASDFGVPQKRKRVIIIGVNEQNGPDLEAIHETLHSLANQMM